MELTWWVVAIVGCVGLANCIAAVLLRPMEEERRQLRLLANVGRLTRLPEYRRAARLRTLSAVVAIGLLVVIFGASVVAAARPTGLPAVARQSGSAQPEDIMLCMGGPATEPAVGATLRYFADRVKTFTTQRIGLTSSNPRVVPLTRDYQYAAAQFNEYAGASERSADAVRWAPAVSYVDYAGGVEDVLAMCLTGFPSFDQKTAQRRSLIYVGPGSLRVPGEKRPALFTADDGPRSGEDCGCPGQRGDHRIGERCAGRAGPRHRRPCILGKCEHYRPPVRDQGPPAIAGGR